MLMSDSYQPDLERDANAYDLAHLEARQAGVVGGVRLVRGADGGTGQYTFTNVEDPFGYVVYFRADTGALLDYRDIGRQRFNGKIVLDLNGPTSPSGSEDVDALLAEIV